jgi:hypothetical protein
MKDLVLFPADFADKTAVAASILDLFEKSGWLSHKFCIFLPCSQENTVFQGYYSETGVFE